MKLMDILVLDDKKEDLESICSALTKDGHFVIPIHNEDSQNTLEICQSIKSSGKCIRVIITDIQMFKTQGAIDLQDETRKIADLLSAMFKGNNNHQYILLAWTTKEVLFEDFKTTLVEILTQNGTKLPLSIEEIIKDECKDTYLEYLPEKILCKFYDIIKAKKELAALFDWENKCIKATAETVNEVLTTEDSSKTLKLLAKEVVGEGNLCNCPEAINTALLYILKDKLNKLEIEAETKHAISELFRCTQIVENDLSPAKKAKLNTLLHIETKSNDNIIYPGDFFELIDKTILGYFSDKENPSILNSIDADTIYELGKRFIHSFCNPRKPETFTNGEWKREKKRLLDKWSQALRVGLVEISPYCDFAQNKRNNCKRYILTVLIPFDNYFAPPNGASINGNMLISIDGVIYYLSLDAHHIFTLPDDFIKYNNPSTEEKRFNKLFRVRESMLQSWIQKIANHNSRIGTISF